MGCVYYLTVFFYPGISDSFLVQSFLSYGVPVGNLYNSVYRSSFSISVCFLGTFFSHILSSVIYLLQAGNSYDFAICVFVRSVLQYGMF